MTWVSNVRIVILISVSHVFQGQGRELKLSNKKKETKLFFDLYYPEASFLCLHNVCFIYVHFLFSC